VESFWLPCRIACRDQDGRSPEVFDFIHRLASDQIPIQHHITDDMWLLDDGSVFGMFELTGMPWETAGEETIAGWKNTLNRILKNLADDTIILYVYDCRGLAPDSVYPPGNFTTKFSADLDAAYRRNLFARGLFRNRLYLGVQIRPPRYGGEIIAEQMEIRRKAPVEAASLERVQQLIDVCALLRSELRIYLPRRLGVRVRNHIVFSAMAEALVFALTGLWRPIGLTTGRLGESMLSEHLVFRRETIEFIGPGSSWYGAAFGPKHFPHETRPTMFSRLLASSYRRTVFHTFRFIKTADAQSIMRRKHWRMVQAEDPAVSQADALKEAADKLQSAEWVFGDYGFTLLAFADTPREMVDVATAAWSDLAESGMVVARETRALEQAWYSMIPGNSRLRPRPGYISSLNFASLAPLHGYPLGAERGYWGVPAAIFTTTGRTPYRYHFHVGDVGNTFVSGRVGSGKSTLLAFLICQAERYDATVVVFDVSRGLKMLCRTLGGSYAELRDDLAPLKALTDGEDDCRFLVSLIRGCILADGLGIPLTPEEDRRLHLAVQIVMMLPASDRWLSEVRAFLAPTAVNPNGAGARLEKWCHGQELGWILDNERDTVRLDGRVIGFDQTHILDDPNARGPVIATLYHYCNRLIDGRKLMFVIDEFWKSLLDPAFRALAQERLRTIRKQNAAMILATQSPRDALVSEIRHVIRDQCPSQFYFSNGQAAWEDFGEAGMGLTRTEFDIVRGLRPGTGDFLLKQGDVSVKASLPLGGMDDEIAVLSGREANTKLFDRIAADMDAVLVAFHKQRKEPAP
jgi:type IV secretion system protein VirB4